jgi:hypothetical protein
MRFVGQTVDHRHSRVFRQFVQLRGFSRSQHDRIDITRQYARGISWAFTPARLHIGRVQDDHVAAQLPHADLERDARARGRFLKYQRQRFAGQRTRRHAARFLVVRRDIQHLP